MVTLRPARAEDLEAVTALHRALLAEEAAAGGPPETQDPRKHVRRALGAADRHVAVVEVDGRVVAYGECALLPKRTGRLRALLRAWLPPSDIASDEGAICFIFVGPEARGGGLGKRMAEHLVAHLAGRGVRVVHSHVRAGNDASLAMLRAAGFEVAATMVRRVLPR